eukprot:TRINITY_DN39797_c0_g1_i1.p1 TRINITY_DN39797_c0_g1~~TRINITY_DN39797_c0_g1_i1.p1  ORF type:complete len:163 (-),score=17.43 TRINITY_DN39797_c0_g1_i1:99-566(-)
MSARVVRTSADGSGSSGKVSGTDASRSSSDLAVEVGLKRTRPHKPHTLRAYTPYFPKMKDEGWWLLLSSETSDLLALKRVAFTDRSTTCLNLPHLPSNHKVTVQLISDCYVGLDKTATVTVGDHISSKEKSITKGAQSRTPEEDEEETFYEASTE